MEFRRIKLSETSTNKLQVFKARTKLTPNIACRLALGLSLAQKSLPSLELYTEDSGQEINRYTLLGEHDLVLTSLFTQWCYENSIDKEKYYDYFMAHINRGVELLTNRVKGVEGLLQLMKEN